MPNLSNGLRQAYEVQDLAYDAMQALRKALETDGELRVTRDDAQAIRNLATVWREAQERIAFHRRVPGPGNLRPDARPTRRKARADRADDPFNGVAPAPSSPVYPAPGPGSAPAVMRDTSTVETSTITPAACGAAARVDPPVASVIQAPAQDGGPTAP